MVQTPNKTITLEEFLKLPETKPASEYINGEIIQKPMPQGKHSILQTELCPAINRILKPQRIAHAFSELRCVFGGRAIVPDISVFTWSRIPKDVNGEIANVFELAPDWVIEILSPDQSSTKVTKKILHCLDHGCLMGWLIDPSDRAVIVFSSNQKPQLFDEADQVVSAPEWAAELQLTVGELFGWLQLS
ncbi:Uma2 family endonuclease [Phormidesmis sp. 146-33]